jgi:hypothetical protein
MCFSFGIKCLCLNITIDHVLLLVLKFLQDMESSADSSNVAVPSLVCVAESMLVPYPVAAFTGVEDRERGSVFADVISQRFQAKMTDNGVLEISEVARDANADPAWSVPASGLTAMVIVSPREIPESEPIQVMSMHNIKLEIGSDLRAYLVSNSIKHELGSAKSLLSDADEGRTNVSLEWSYNAANNSHVVSVNGRAIGSTLAVAASVARDPSDVLISVQCAFDVAFVALWRQPLSLEQISRVLAHHKLLMSDLNDATFTGLSSSSASAADSSKPWFERANALEVWQRGRVAPDGGSVTLRSATDGIDSLSIVDSGTGVFECRGEPNSPAIRTVIADAIVTSGTWVFEVRVAVLPCLGGLVLSFRSSFAFMYFSCLLVAGTYRSARIQF